MVAELAASLTHHRLTLCTAESCTGGLVAHWLTEVPGSSSWFLGGVVAYSNALKGELLGIDLGLLQDAGAVSEEVAEAMAKNAADRLGSDLALSTTGIAGPGGGTANKPVGLVYFGLSGFENCRVRKAQWPHGRSENKEASARFGIEMIVDLLRSEFPS